MMQATKHGKRDDLSTRSGRVRRWCSGNPLAESLMRPANVEKAHVRCKHGLEMPLSENEVIAFTASSVVLGIVALKATSDSRCWTVNSQDG